MFRLQRSILSKPGKIFKAIQLGQEAVSYLNEKYPGFNFQFFLELFGDSGNIYMVSEFENLDAYAELNTKTMADEKYVEIVAKMTDLAVEGRIKDTLMRLLF